MPLKPPKGMGPVIATRPVPTGLRATVITCVAVAAVVLFFFNLSGAMDALGPVGYGLFGIVGAVAVLVPKQASYAAGHDWIRRGDSWVVTTDLTEAKIDDQTLRLRDSSPRRKIALPAEILVDNEGLFTALAEGVRRSDASGDLDADDRIRDLFSLPRNTTA